MKVLLSVVCFFAVVSALVAEEATPPLNILIVTGGHDFDQPNFYKIFDEMPNLRYDKAEVPDQMDLLAPGLEKKYDLLLTYDMNNFPQVTTEQRERFAKLIESGMPLVVMHHSVCGHDNIRIGENDYYNWPLYREMIGGQYLHRPVEIDGKIHSPATYKHNLNMAIEVVDKEHPITKGIENFTIIDEGYKGLYIRQGIHVLLKTDHPDATAEVAWTTKYGKGTVFVTTLGHDRQAYENPNLRKLLYQAIQWCVAQSRDL